MMKIKMLSAGCCLVLLLAGCNKSADTSPTVPDPAAGSNAATEAEEPVMDKDTLLSINGQPVSKELYSLYFRERARGLPADAQNSPELQMRVLNELSNVLIAAQDAESKDIDQRPEVAAALTLTRAKLLTQTMLQEYAEANMPTEEQINTYYQAEYVNQNNQEYKARHILVKEEAEAKALIEELDKGADFAELAKTHSTGPTGKKGGDLGWFDPKQMVKPFADAVASLDKGSYTKQPVQTQFGWHVILLEDVRQNEPPSLEGVRGDITTSLQQKTVAAYMQELRSKSKIVFNKKLAEDKRPPADAAQDQPASDAASASAAKEQNESGTAAQAPADDNTQQNDKPASE